MIMYVWILRLSKQSFFVIIMKALFRLFNSDRRKPESIKSKLFLKRMMRNWELEKREQGFKALEANHIKSPRKPLL